MNESMDRGFCLIRLLSSEILVELLFMAACVLCLQFFCKLAAKNIVE